MESRWSESEARALVSQYSGVSEELALRVYSSRLIGSDPSLVLHGGGNTSLKSRAVNLFGDDVEVLHVKGSGWDLAAIEPAGLPALELAPLLRLRGLESLDDQVMVACLRAALLQPSAPNPSVETLLHAFLPGRFIDHSHADAVLALTNQPDGEKRCRALWGDRIAWVPYIMPGLLLAKRAAEIYEKNPDVHGLVLEKHGLFTFGDDARTSYERHVALVDRAEREIARAMEGRRVLGARPVVATREAGEVAPILRGVLAEPLPGSPARLRRFILEHRSSDEILHFAAAAEGPMLAASGPITPDHVIRTKSAYLLVERPPYGDLSALRAELAARVEAYREEYQRYFERCAAGRSGLRPLDPTPRVVVLPGIGVFAAGETLAAARLAADIAEHTIRTKIWAQTLGHYVALGERELFEMEYWSLEQAKLGRASAPPLAGQTALVTGGAGAIGEGIARCLLDAGAHVLLCDCDEQRLAAVRARLASPACETVIADVADDDSVAEAVARATALYGGLDLVVVNAGVAVAGSLRELEVEDFERALQVNLTGAFVTLRHALSHFALQGTGGNIVVISSKNVFAPGAEFGAYSASKAGAHQLGRIAALEGAPLGVRVNMINADAVFGEPENPSGLWRDVGPARARARGLPEAELEGFYRKRSLLQRRVTAADVGRAVVFFASEQTPTTGAALPVDGGIPEAFPR
jgi:rhamnulose-1-phosphate aldolase/alcohol dehydrogenase